MTRAFELLLAVALIALGTIAVGTSPAYACETYGINADTAIIECIDSLPSVPEADEEEVEDSSRSDGNDDETWAGWGEDPCAGIANLEAYRDCLDLPRSNVVRLGGESNAPSMTPEQAAKHVIA
ncbi:hypothetical protein [Microlunatus speluncae]|uniref:hypothetical protein n=1 Tax=Microlunatus speluncae TaxID=2594267 RepID=UPI0012663A03|nr:hypothetical protein [Microlunatus speluncae]